MLFRSQGLAAQGLNAKMPISVKLREVTVTDVLSTALERAGLAYRIEEGNIIITVARRRGAVAEGE